MAFIKEGQKQETGRKLYGIFQSAKQSIINIKDAKTMFQTQVAAMKLNSDDYTEADWKEIQAFIDDLNTDVETI